ncbi:NADP-dependent alcohol hydrogenase, putative [Bodo saltans]|uniref:NADP-dependent alcohol hydrogenase, putative n=1 Tax=Bodo saltans TaxID=75058 RepID=A0A0S4IZG8_BODSA|nr:NADP-dependent alcohol hydrogenase, putative [Bodo saltans]|eukprot:CUG24300.1 NADP-dependent alcohol hydrogenase, putative [Bodo saltans]
MRRAGIKAGGKIGVVGLGGLGSMAVKFGKAFGAHVTVFTTSSSKVELAKSIGADHVAVISPGAPAATSPPVRGLQFILDTASATHDLNPYLTSLGVGGRLVLVGLPETPHPPIKPGLLVSGGRSVYGSYIGGIPETQEMLDFCGVHQISCEAELIAAKDVETAFAKLKKNEGRGRFVIDMNTLKDFYELQ